MGQYFGSSCSLALLRNLGRFQKGKRHLIDRLLLHLFVQFHSRSIGIMGDMNYYSVSECKSNREYTECVS